MVKDAVASTPVFTFLAIRFTLATAAMLLLLCWPWLTSRLGARSSDNTAIQSLPPPGTDERRTTNGPSVLRPPSFVPSSLGTQQSHTSSIAPLGPGILIGLFLFASYAFQTSGLQYTTPAKAAFITGLSVVFVPLLATLFWRKLPSPAALLGVLLATVGLAFLSLNAGLSVNRGDLLVLGCAVALALHILTTGVFAPRSDPLRLAGVQLLTVALLSGLAAVLWENPLILPSRSVWFAAAFTGLLASTFAFGAQTVAQRFTSATHTALIFVSEPVFAALFSYAMGRETLTARAWLGCGLILAGMLAAELGQPLWAKLRRRRRP